MQEKPESQSSYPPKNTGLQQLVEAKRKWSIQGPSSDNDSPFRGWNQRGYLPHRDEPGLTQAVTIRLADALPLRCIQAAARESKSNSDKERVLALEQHLDRGEGECHLWNPEIAMLVEETFRHFDEARYHLHAWVVMPNHAHVLFTQISTSLSVILESWKKHTARKANRILRRQGRFWQVDYWDTYMRDEEHKKNTLIYIETNPSRAGLVSDPKAWPFSSARFRDSFGRLNLREVNRCAQVDETGVGSTASA